MPKLVIILQLLYKITIVLLLQHFLQAKNVLSSTKCHLIAETQKYFKFSRTESKNIVVCCTLCAGNKTIFVIAKFPSKSLNNC